MIYYARILEFLKVIFFFLIYIIYNNGYLSLNSKYCNLCVILFVK